MRRGKAGLLHCLHIDDWWTSAQVLLESGSDIDAVEENGWTALFIASFLGHLDVVKVTSRAILRLESHSSSNRFS